MSENPFNITFGKEPNSIISRRELLDEVYDSFSSNNPSSQVYILTGIRGSGKTVAMTTVTEYFKKKDEWIIIELNPESDMLAQLASKIYDEGTVKKLFLTVDFNFSFHGFGLSITGNTPVSNVSSLLKREFEYLKSKDIKVLITVDEALSNGYMKIFAHEFQTFLREDYKVCLIMTGLYQNISLLEKQKSLTFLYRAPKIYMTGLNPRAVTNTYKNIFKITESQSIELAKFIKGYAYAYQVLGNILYKNKKIAIDDEVIREFDEILYSRAYNIIYSELSGKEKLILNCAIQSNDNASVMKLVNLDKTQLSAYKKRLVTKGVLIDSKTSIDFALPRFEEFLKFNALYSEIE